MEFDSRMVIHVLPNDATAIDSTIDRQNLVELRKRFLQINADRLHRLDMALSHQQTLLLKTLALLFHTNHPMLPGFVSHSTPSGVCEYKPSKSELAHAKGIARSFSLSGGYHGEDIWGIYLMGSVGTLAQSHKSDLDIWLCYRPGLSKPALQELQQKCSRISQYAANQRLEMHFFLMDSEAFRRGQSLVLDDESSGSAQRLLLLDEFYRTAIFVAGRLPLWWFCPSAIEEDYHAHCKQLLDKRFLRPETTLDFGSTQEIPAGEFIGAGIWQLYKAIDSPYKSVLKLLLMEAYVHDYPNIEPLSLAFKQTVYAGSLEINELDPYVMVYRKIEAYLNDLGDTDRLELARRCLYFKVNKALSRPPANTGKSWQRLLLEKLVKEWGWSDDYLQMLDQHRQWKTMQVKQERNQLVQALNRSYDVLTEFAQRSGSGRSISNAELHVLGRKLQAAFERRPDKIEWVNPGISADISETVLSFVQGKTISADAKSEQWIWQLYGDQTGPDTPLRQSQSPVELLLWAYRNRIVDEQFRMDVKEAPNLNESQLRRCLNRLQTWLPNPKLAASHEDFKSAATPTHALMLINIGAETLSPYGADVHRLSDHSDPLQYGALNENLVASIDLVVRNSWQEITCQRFIGKGALLQALQAYAALCMPGSYQAPPLLELECLGSHHAALITQRVRQWFHEFTTCYYSGTKPPATRFIFSMAGRYYSLQFKGPKLVILDHADLEQLNRYLGEAQKRYSPIVLDSHCLRTHPLRIIARKASAKAINVFYFRRESAIHAWISDEKGSLMSTKLDYTRELNALAALHRFTRTILERIQARSDAPSDPDFSIFAVEFHELRPDQQHIKLIPRTIQAQRPERDIYLQASVTSNEQGQFSYDFTVAGQTFSWDQLGQDVFYAVAEFMLSIRHGKQRYPVFINDLDLDHCAAFISSTQSLQLSHYLRIKLELERKLSRAIAQLN